MKTIRSVLLIALAVCANSIAFAIVFTFVFDGSGIRTVAFQVAEIAIIAVALLAFFCAIFGLASAKQCFYIPENRKGLLWSIFIYKLCMISYFITTFIVMFLLSL